MKFNDFYILFLIAFAIIAIKPANAQKQTSASSIVYTTGHNSSQTKNQRADYWIGGSDNSIYYQNGFVGIGTSSPEANLHVQGNMKMGSNIGAVGTNAFAGGDGSTASGTNAFAFGENSNASGTDAVSIGFWSEATSDKSFALGFYNQSNTAFSYLFGQWLKSTVSSNITIGFGAGQSPLVNNKHRSLMMGMNSNFPTIYIGPSDGIGTTGRIGIGNMTDPQAKLHMLSDEDEAATLKLEHQLTGTNRYAEIGLGTHRIYAGNFDNMVFETPDSTKHFAFENGKVGIGTSSPEANLHVQGNMNVGNNPHTGSIIGENAFVGGEESEASGFNSFAYGDRAKAANTGAFAVGLRAEANGRYSTAIGRGSMANHDNAIALGYATEASATNTIVIGKHARASVSNAYIIGSGVGLSTSMLVNEVDHSLIIGFESNVPTFFVGPSDGIGTTGRIGIGNVTDPQAKLHIRADEEEDASLKLEASSGGRSMVILSESHEMSYETDENLHFRTAQNKAFVFHQGDIFIEDIQSGIIMRSPNGQCWRGRVNDQGMLAFEQTECPTTGTALQEVGETKHLIKVFPNPASNRMEVVTEGISGPYTLRLLAATGNLMLEQQSHLTQTQLNVQNLPAGAYILMLVQDEQLKDSVKVLVE
jgi:hypothetical protein